MKPRFLGTWKDDDGDVQLISTVLVLVMTLLIITGILLWALPEVQRRSLDVQYRAGITQFETLDMNIKGVMRESASIGNVNGSSRTSHLNIPSGELSIEADKEIWIITSTKREIWGGDIYVEYSSSQNSLTIINYTREGTTTNAPINITYSWLNYSNGRTNIQSPYHSGTSGWSSSRSEWSALEPTKRVTYPIVTYGVGNGSGVFPYTSSTNAIEYTVKTKWNDNVGKKRWEVSLTTPTKLTDVYIQLYTVSGVYDPVLHGWKKIDTFTGMDVLIGEVWILSTDSIKYDMTSSYGNFYIKAENAAILTNYPSSTPYVEKAPIFFNTSDEITLYFVKMNGKGISNGGRGDYEVAVSTEAINKYAVSDTKTLRIQVIGSDGDAWHRYFVSECGFIMDGSAQVKYKETPQNVKLMHYALTVDVTK